LKKTTGIVRNEHPVVWQNRAGGLGATACLAPLGHLIAVDVHSQEYCGDFSNPEGIAETVRRIKPDVIVNAAAHTAVDKAESEPNLLSC
jgi:dTDP-4-dehydrorhamnose reductase